MSYVPKRNSLPAKFVPGFLRKLDGRLAVAMRLKDLYDEIIEDQGGFGNIPATKRVMIERFVFLSGMIEQWEAQVHLDPSSADALVGRMTQAANSLQGLGRIIGYERRDQGVVTLQQYVAAKEGA